MDIPLLSLYNKKTFSNPEDRMIGAFEAVAQLHGYT